MTYEDLRLVNQQAAEIRRYAAELQNEGSSLLRLPVEIRDEIYTFSLSEALKLWSQTICSENSILLEPPFFRTSRRIRSECHSLLLHKLILVEEHDLCSKTWRTLHRETILWIRPLVRCMFRVPNPAVIKPLCEELNRSVYLLTLLDEAIKEEHRCHVFAAKHCGSVGSQTAPKWTLY